MKGPNRVAASFLLHVSHLLKGFSYSILDFFFWNVKRMCEAKCFVAEVVDQERDERRYSKGKKL